jgi:hypothetical protein
MVFLYSAIKCVLVFLAVLFVAIRSPPTSILLHVNAFFPTTNCRRRCNHCRPIPIQSLERDCNSNNWSISSSPPPSSSLFGQSPWLQRQSYYEDDAHYEDHRTLQQQQQESIEQRSLTELNEPCVRQPTSHQQQRSFEKIVSYDTGGNSFAEPIEQSELSVGRRNGKTMYSEVGVCSTSTSRSGAYRLLKKNSKPDILSPELTVGRTSRYNGNKYTNGGQLHQQENQSRLGGGGGGILQHYGTGTYSFSQPINAPELTTSRSRSRSDGGRPQSLSFKKQVYSDIHYIRSLQSSNVNYSVDNDNDEYRNGNW